jgi:hypothetical protein
MNLLPQDILIMIKLALLPSQDWSYNTIAYGVGHESIHGF